MTTEIVDVETDAEMVPIGQYSIYQSTDPREQLEEMENRAKVLFEYVDKMGLAKKLGGDKPHVQVEGWQFIGSQVGLFPFLEWTKEIENGYMARVLLKRASDGAVVGAGESQCRFTESNWKNKDHYAVQSMAETRAVSKAFRNSPVVAVMVLAGFAATPAEEMDGVAAQPASVDDPHCPACLDANGELVGVWENDKKPFWKCKAKEACAAYDGKYAWSGWHESYENSVADYLGKPVVDAAETKTIDPDVRMNRNEYVIREVMALTGITNSPDAGALVKPGLRRAVAAGAVDVEEALGWDCGPDPTDDELRVLYANLTLVEADVVVAEAANVRLEQEAPFE